MAVENDAENTTDSETELEDDQDFWNRRVYALAFLIGVTQLPDILMYPTAAGMVGGLTGAVLASLAVAGVLKAFYMVTKMIVLAVVRWIKSRL